MLSNFSNPLGSSTTPYAAAAAPTNTDSSMGAAMDTAFAAGTPTDAASANEIVSTAPAYLSGASGMLGRLEEGIRIRTQALPGLERTDPAAAKSSREQIDLLERLQARVQLSMERISDILAGKDRADIGSDAGGIDISDLGTRGSVAATKDEQLALLEQRRAMLAPSADSSRSFGDVSGAYRAS
jgi:hypothetical protein